MSRHNTRYLFLAVVLVLLASPTFAGTGTGTDFGGIAAKFQPVADLVTGPLAKVFGIVAVGLVGFRWLKSESHGGRLGPAVWTALGIALVTNADLIVTAFGATV